MNVYEMRVIVQSYHPTVNISTKDVFRLYMKYTKLSHARKNRGLLLGATHPTSIQFSLQYYVLPRVEHETILPSPGYIQIFLSLSIYPCT